MMRLPMNPCMRRILGHVFLVPCIVLAVSASTGAPCLAGSKEAAAGAGEWPEITPAERALPKVEQDPEADAVVLINDRNGKNIQQSNAEWVNFLVFVDPWFFAGEEFTLRSRLTQVVPNGTSYAILCDLCGSVKPDISDWHEARAKGQKYSVELRNLPGYREELMMPPAREVSPRMEMVLQSWKDVGWEALGRQDRLFIDWPSVAKFYSYYYQGVIKGGQQAIKPVVDQWVSGLADPHERIKSVARHVQEDFRYLSLFRFVTFRPDPIDKLLK